MSRSPYVIEAQPLDDELGVLRGWKRELLQPGEMGGSPRLYFSAVVTH